MLQIAIIVSKAIRENLRQLRSICQKIAGDLLHELGLELRHLCSFVILTLSLLRQLATIGTIIEVIVRTNVTIVRLLSLVEIASSLLKLGLRIIERVAIFTASILRIKLRQLVLGKSRRLLVLHSDIDFHHVQCQLVLNILTYIVSILTMAIADAEVPQVLDLGEILHDKEVVLIRL